MVLIVAMTAGMVDGLGGCGKKNGDELTITNVSYDPTREFYEKYNVLFEQYYEKNFGKKVRVIQSHGGSGPFFFWPPPSVPAHALVSSPSPSSPAVRPRNTPQALPWMPGARLAVSFLLYPESGFGPLHAQIRP